MAAARICSDHYRWDDLPSWPLRFDVGMAPHFLPILTGRNLPVIWQLTAPEPSTINEKTIADFARVVDQTGILEGEPTTEGPADEPR